VSASARPAFCGTGCQLRGNLQQRSCLGVGGQSFGGQGSDLLLHLVVIDNAVHLHAQLGELFLELR
jgi:hypothetical protein